MSRQTIIAVDDEYANRFLLENTLTEYNLKLASSAAELWEYLSSAEPLPDLILLDVMMPRESGFDVAEKLANHPKYRPIPVIFLSARVSGDDVAQGLELGGQDYVKKPFEEEELKARIRTTLARSAERKELAQGASIDGLTGAHRREVFMENAYARFEFARRKGVPFAIALADIDDFKSVNDTFGHQAGDAVLKNVGTLLSAELREYDLLGRYGGEEFILALLEESKESGGELMERLRSKIASTAAPFEGREITVTLSIGVADTGEIAEVGEGLEALIALADQRLYRAKALGKNQVRLD